MSMARVVRALDLPLGWWPSATLACAVVVNVIVLVF